MVAVQPRCVYEDIGGKVLVWCVYSESILVFVYIGDLMVEVVVDIVYCCGFCEGDGAGVGRYDAGGWYPETCGAGDVWFVVCYCFLS